MSPRPSGTAIVIVILLAPFAAGAQSNAVLKERMLLAEDARAQTDAELSSLRQGLTNRDVAIRLQAVRAIGRLERPDLIPALTRPLADENVEVRIEAANAVGQLARGPKGVEDAKQRLLARAKIEGDPRAWGAIAATLGRLPYTDCRRRRSGGGRHCARAARRGRHRDSDRRASRRCRRPRRPGASERQDREAQARDARGAAGREQAPGPGPGCRQAGADPAFCDDGVDRERRGAAAATRRVDGRRRCRGASSGDGGGARRRRGSRGDCQKGPCRRQSAGALRSAADLGPRAAEDLLRTGRCGNSRRQHAREAARDRPAGQRLSRAAAADWRAAGAGRHADARAGRMARAGACDRGAREDRAGRGPQAASALRDA